MSNVSGTLAADAKTKKRENTGAPPAPGRVGVSYLLLSPAQHAHGADVVGVLGQPLLSLYPLGYSLSDVDWLQKDGGGGGWGDASHLSEEKLKVRLSYFKLLP